MALVTGAPAPPGVWENVLPTRAPTPEEAALPAASACRRGCLRGQVLTVTFHPLVDESVQQGPTVVTKRGAGVGVDLKLVLAPGILRSRETTAKRGGVSVGAQDPR